MDEEKSERNIIQFDKNYIIGQTIVDSGIYLSVYAQVKNIIDSKWTIRVVVYPAKELNCNILGSLSHCIKDIKDEEIIFNTAQEATDYLEKLSEKYNWEYTFDC